jgi:hypothetical protein
MTLNPYARVVLDASALAASGLSFELQTKTLRTAVHAGVRWIFCPTEDAQRLAGRAMFDLPKWKAIAPLTASAGIDELFGLSLRLRRNRIDLAILPDAQCRAARTARDAARDGILGGIGLRANDTAQLMTALRHPGATSVMFGADLDGPGWRDPSALAAVMAKRGIEGFAPPGLANAPGVANVIHAPDSPRALFRLLRDYRPRRPAPLPGLAEAA